MVGATAFLLATVNRFRMVTSIAFSADHLITVLLLGQNSHARIDNTNTQTKNQVKSRFFLDVVIT